MYRAYFYLPNHKGALYSLPFPSLATAIDQSQNEIGEGEPGLYAKICKRGKPNNALWDSRNPKELPLSEQEQIVIALHL